MINVKQTNVRMRDVLIQPSKVKKDIDAQEIKLLNVEGAKE